MTPADDYCDLECMQNPNHDKAQLSVVKSATN